GLKHEAYNTVKIGVENKYKYNGKELQDEMGLGFYDYGARHYMPDLGRWIEPDPLLNDLDFKFDPNDIDEDDEEEVAFAMKTTLGNGGGIFNTDNLNPYSYGYNDPVRFEDPDGKCPICVFVVAALVFSEFANAPTGNRQVDSRNYNQSKSNKTLVSEAVLAGGARTILNSAKSKAVEKVIEKSSEKKVPNPNGKNGGEAHQKTVDKSEAKLKKEGFTETRREVKIETPKGEKSKRFVDVEGKNPKTGEVKQIQVGKQNKNGTPVARERRAIDDIHQATGKKPEFVPYN
ncbi:RHS repeat-associated core domain-containing protein, partial [Flavobacterium ginsengiterrae]|uniref:RHS repeat domain-containing protein n=1 Tax=Flavobacterium ginsengiterrae TaxID=871695 RepID=UPI0031E690E0